MGRHTGPVCRLARREGVNLFIKGLRSDKCLSKRPQPPGMHPWSRPKTEYARQLREKQKLKRYYGVWEKQFSNYFKQAERLKGDTGENLIILLERRLDNVVRRLGLALTVAQARQFIVHRHIHVNGKRVDRPSYSVKKGDVITAAPKEKSQKLIKSCAEVDTDVFCPSWLNVSVEDLKGQVMETPVRDEVLISSYLEERLIVELMSK